MPEWLGSGLQNRLQGFNSPRRLQHSQHEMARSGTYRTGLFAARTANVVPNAIFVHQYSAIPVAMHRFSALCFRRDADLVIGRE